MGPRRCCSCSSIVRIGLFHSMSRGATASQAPCKDSVSLYKPGLVPGKTHVLRQQLLHRRVALAFVQPLRGRQIGRAHDDVALHADVEQLPDVLAIAPGGRGRCVRRSARGPAGRQPVWRLAARLSRSALQDLSGAVLASRKPGRTFPMRKSLGVALALLFGIVAAQAQSFPTRPVTAIVPASAGGPTDTIARIVMARAQHCSGRPSSSRIRGVSGTIGTGRVVRDGTRWLHNRDRGPERLCGQPSELFVSPTTR